MQQYDPKPQDVAEKKIVAIQNYSSCANAYAALKDKEHGFAQAQNASDAPTTGTYQIESWRDSSTFGWQTARNTSSDKMYARYLYTGNWSSWACISLTEASSVTDMTSAFGATEGTIKFIRWGKVRILNFDSAKAPASTGYFTFDSFASGDRPGYYAHGILSRADNHTVWNFWVRINGTVGQSNYSANTTASGAVIWIVP